LASGARLVVTAFWLASAAFAFLSSVPFAYEQFIAPRLVPGLVEFAEWHRWAAPAMAALTWLGLGARLTHERARAAARATLTLAAGAGVVLPLAPPLAALEPNTWALVASVAALTIPLGVAVTDLLAAPAWTPVVPEDRTGTDFAALAATGVFVTGVYALRASAAGPVENLGGGVAASLLVHGVFAAVVFLVITAIRGAAAARGRYAPRREFWMSAAVIVAVFEVLAVGIVLPTLSVSSAGGTAAAAALAFTLALGLVARGRHGRAPLDDGMQTALAAFVPSWMHHGGWVLQTATWLAVVAAVATGFAAASGVMDWNFVLARIGALLTWLVAVGGALALMPRALARPTAGAAFAGCVAVLVAHQALVPVPGLAAASPADRWAVVDPSYRMLRELLRPPTPSDPTFYPFLQRNTNLGRDVTVGPVDVSLAPLDGTLARRRPHIFLFVVDSLRRDYLSPYNDAVTFTPNIGRFAAESVAFQRVYTRYGATGLSVPSIWVGGMILHKQYVQPFAPMNALHKLLADQRYTRWMSWDNVVDATVPHVDEGPALDSTRAVKDFRFCETVAEILPRLGALKAGGEPTFTWALPQDIHISAITREGQKAVDQEDYGAFYAPYASRLRRIDGCFGQFIDGLKAAGLYDDSVVILTADHGDSLGEDGRWGHAYTLFPEILQVPLVMHLPDWFLASHAFDPGALAFTTDITPTLYAMLGRAPTPPAPMFGAPLFWPKDGASPERPGDGHLVASSYGSVYGWISDRGRRLYVADGVDFRDYQFVLDGSPTGRVEAVGGSDRRDGQQAIRAAVEAIAAFYGFASGS
jgi:hypothetical protein